MRSNMKKQAKIIITGLVILALVAILGGKLYMDNQNKQNEKVEMKQEKQAALQAKRMFRDIKQIKILEVSEGSPGSKWFSVKIVQKNNKGFETSLLLGSDDFIVGQDAINEEGSTSEEVSVIYLNKNEEVLK